MVRLKVNIVACFNQVNSCFNSNMVRLKVFRDKYLKNNYQKFQFQYGTIKRPVPRATKGS